MDKIEVILKLAARCNINCTYCYVFNGADDSTLKTSKVVSDRTLYAIGEFLRDGVLYHGIQYVQIDFHGGEPLLIGKDRFVGACRILSDALQGHCELQLCLQTNAILVDHEWIQIFEEFDIAVGISIDGERDHHDLRRVDFLGRGTYDVVVQNGRLLQRAARNDRIREPGVLSVIDPSMSGKDSYNHLVHELGYRSVDFLVPDETHDAARGYRGRDIGRFLIEVFNAWASNDDPLIQVRYLNSVLSLLLGGRTRVIGLGRKSATAFTVNTDGELQPDDFLRSCGKKMIHTNQTVWDSTLSQFLTSPHMKMLAEAFAALPTECCNCRFSTTCGGGNLGNRYSEARKFDNPSIHCEGLLMLFEHVETFLLQRGEIPISVGTITSR